MSVSNVLQKHAPSIEALSLCAALAGSWTGAFEWLANGMAIFVACSAVLLFASARRRSRPWSADEADSRQSWIANELAGQGTPPGHYVLAFFAIVTIALTGFDTAYAMLAWAALALGIAWGAANANYSSDSQSSG